VSLLLSMKSTLDKCLRTVLILSTVSIFSIVIVLVMMRYLFNSTLVGANELITILFVYTTVIGAAVAVGQRAHISVSVVVEKLPIWHQKLMDILALALIAFINGAMVWYSLTSWIPVTGRFLMPALQMPQFYAQVAVPVGGSLAIVYCILLILISAGPSQDSRTPD
jgi:TRAP-type C4-dicarboxylate transport system permease small subunit